MQLANLITGAHEALAAHPAVVGPVTQRSIKFAMSLSRTLFRLLKLADTRRSPCEDLVSCVVTAVFFAYVAGCPGYRSDFDNPAVPTTPRLAVLRRMKEILHQAPEFGFLADKNVIRLTNDVCKRIVNTKNFTIPSGIALTECMRQMLLLGLISVVSDVPHIPVAFVGEPGLGKTQSVHILVLNMKGEFSPTPFFKTLGYELRVIWLQGSSSTTGEHITSVMNRAIEIQSRKPDKFRVLVAFDEAGLSLDRLKAMHQHQDEGQIAFIALSNRRFDTANQNRMVTYLRDVRLEDDLRERAYGCLLTDAGGRDAVSYVVDSMVKLVVRLSMCGDKDPLKPLSQRYHLRDFVYLWRCLRLALKPMDGGAITPMAMLRALEYNFSGVPEEVFKHFVKELFGEVRRRKPLTLTTEWLPPAETQYRPVLQVLRESLERDREVPQDVSLRPRYKMFVDPSDNCVVSEATLAAMFPNTRRHEIWLSNAPEDATALGDSRAVAELIHCMENGHLAVIINGDRIHGHLFDVYNQHYNAHRHYDGNEEKTSYFCRVSAGAETREVIVHPDFRVVVVMTKTSYEQHVKASDGAFLSRFEIYMLPSQTAEISSWTLQRCLDFIDVMGAHNFKAFDRATTPQLAAQALDSHVCAAPIPTGLSRSGVDAWKMNSIMLELLPPEIAILRIDNTKRREETWREYLAQGHLSFGAALRSHNARHASKNLLIYTEDRVGLHALTSQHTLDLRFNLDASALSVDADRFAKEDQLKEYLIRELNKHGYIILASRVNCDGERVNRLRHVVDHCTAVVSLREASAIARVVLIVIPEAVDEMRQRDSSVPTHHRAVFTASWTSTCVDQLADSELSDSILRRVNLKSDQPNDDSEYEDFKAFLYCARYARYDQHLREVKSKFSEDCRVEALPYYEVPGPNRLLKALDAIPGLTLNLAAIFRLDRTATQHEALRDAAKQLAAQTRRTAPLSVVYTHFAAQDRQDRATRVVQIITAEFGLANLFVADREKALGFALYLIRLVAQSPQRYDLLQRHRQSSQGWLSSCFLNPWLRVVLQGVASETMSVSLVGGIESCVKALRVPVELSDHLSALNSTIADAYCDDVVRHDILRDNPCLQSLKANSALRIRAALGEENFKSNILRCVYVTLIDRFPSEKKEVMGDLVTTLIWRHLELDSRPSFDDPADVEQTMLRGIAQKLEEAYGDNSRPVANSVENCSNVFDLLTTWLIPRSAAKGFPAAVAVELASLFTKLEWFFVVVATYDRQQADDATLRRRIGELLKPDVSVSSHQEEHYPFSCTVTRRLSQIVLATKKQERQVALHLMLLHAAEAPDAFFDNCSAQYSFPDWLRLAKDSFGLLRTLVHRFVDVNRGLNETAYSLHSAISGMLGADGNMPKNWSLFNHDATPMQLAAVVAYYEFLERSLAQEDRSTLTHTINRIQSLVANGQTAALNASAWYLAEALTSMWTGGDEYRKNMVSIICAETEETATATASLFKDLFAGEPQCKILGAVLFKLPTAEAADFLRQFGKLFPSNALKCLMPTTASKDGIERPFVTVLRLPPCVRDPQHPDYNLYFKLRPHVLSGEVNEALLEPLLDVTSCTRISRLLFVVYLVDVVFGVPGAQTASVEANVRLLLQAQGLNRVLQWSKDQMSLLQLMLFPEERLRLIALQLGVPNVKDVSDAALSWLSMDFFAAQASDVQGSSILWALARASNRSELQALLQCLPDKIRIAVLNDPDFNVDTLEEVFVHLGQRIEIRAETLVKRLDIQPTVDDMRYILSKTGKFADDGRGCIAGTLHRVSCWMSRTGTVLGVTMRVGRYLPGVAAPFLDRARSGNLLFLSKPGQGKTTMLRDLAVSLARRSDSPRVVVIDSANEIGGDSDAPLPCMGRVRRLQVPKRSMQLNYMTQAVQNHSPDYVIIDEIATTEEADAALTMSQRGVRLIATAHGETLGKLVQNKALNYLVGGVAQAFLSNEERKLKLKIKKTVLERPYDAPFTTVVELRSRKHAMMHVRVNESVDMLLDDRDPWQDRKCCKVIRYENGPGQSSGLPLPRALVESSEDDDTPTTSSTERITRDLRKGDEDAMDDFDLDDAPSSSTRFRAVKAAKVDDDGYSLSDRT